jgi:hypothetical protein
MMRNKADSEILQLKAIADRILTALPDGWSADALETDTVADRGIDGLITIRSPDGSASNLVFEAKSRTNPASSELVASQLQAYIEDSGVDGALLAAPWLSPRTRALLEARGINYIDATGNLRLVLKRPAVFLATQGATRDPAPPRNVQLRSLKGRSAARIVRGMLDFLPPYTVTEFAGFAGSNVAMTHRVFEFLEAQAIITREPRGPVTEIDWRALLDAWTSDYRFSTSNSIRSYLAPRGTLSIIDQLIDRPRTAITGSTAARGLRNAPTRLLAFYVDDASVAAQELDLREADTGTNVILAEPFDDVVFARIEPTDGLPYAAASQVAADMLTGPGRWPEEAKPMLAWMAQNERAWRARP